MIYMMIVLKTRGNKIWLFSRWPRPFTCCALEIFLFNIIFNIVFNDNRFLSCFLIFSSLKWYGHKVVMKSCWRTRLYPVTEYTAENHAGISYNRRAFEIARRLVASQIAGRGHVQDFPGRAEQIHGRIQEKKFLLVRGQALITASRCVT